MQERHEFDSNPVSLEERLMLNFSSNVVWVLCGIIGILEGEQEGTRTWKLLTMKGHILLESAGMTKTSAVRILCVHVFVCVSLAQFLRF